MKKKIITMTISAIMAFSSMSVLAAEDNNYEYKAEANFNDVSKDYWAYDAIAKCQDLGIICGYGDGNFGPDDPITMEQAIRMSLNTLGLFATGNATEITGENEFASNFEAPIKYARNHKIVPRFIDRNDFSYMNDDQFNQYINGLDIWFGGRYNSYNDYNNNAYREEVVSCFYRVYNNDLGYNYKSTIENLLKKKGETLTINNNPNIPDYGDVTELYKSDIMEAYKLGIAKGYNDAGEFKPKNEITRAEFCQIIENANVTDMLHFKLNGSL